MYKPYLFALCLLFGLAVSSCQKEPFPEPKTTSDVLPAASLALPSYSEAELAALIGNHDDEAVFVAKTELLVKAMVQFWGEHGGLSTNGDLAAELPCDLGLGDPDGILKVMADVSGFNPDAVSDALNDFVYDCSGGCPGLPSGASGYFEAFADDLRYRGEDYDIFTVHEESGAYTSQAKIFLGYGVHYDGSDYRVLGYQYDLNADDLTKEDFLVADVVDLHGQLVLPWADGVARYNDPCYYAYGGGNGGGSGGSGGGSSNLDDDGAQKNGFSGGLVDAPSGYFSGFCSATGVRVTEMHLARDNESGLFSGDLEVYLNVSFYDSSDVATTLLTNENSSKTDKFKNGSVSYTFHRGKQLAELPKSQVSNSSATIVTPTSGYTPNSGDWVIIEEGFCDDPLSGGFNEMYLSIYERDPGFLQFGVWAYEDKSNKMQADGSYYYGDNQLMVMPLTSDRWIELTITPAMFGSQTTLYCVDGGVANSSIQTTQPGSDKSWFKLELY